MCLKSVCAGTQTPDSGAAKLNHFIESDTMNPIKLVGIVLIAAGALGLVYGGFSYPSETTALKLGTVELKVQETKTVNVPLILSAAGIVVGVAMLVFGRSK